MKKKVLSLALVLVLTLALAMSALAAQPNDGIIWWNGLIITNVISTSTEYAADWHEDKENNEWWYWAEEKTYYCAAPATLETAMNWWVWWDTDTEPTIEDAPEIGTLITMQTGIYLYVIDDVAFYLVVGDAAPATPAPQPETLTVNPTPSTVYVNGEAAAFEAYLIGENNYFKLRDLAFALNSSNKQFEIGYDNATAAITITSGQPYTPVGGEMRAGDGSSKSATLNATINISKDGVPVEITAYMIDGNNFMRLRDVMRLLDVYVGYDNATRAITLDTSRGYVEE